MKMSSPKVPKSAPVVSKIPKERAMHVPRETMPKEHVPSERAPKMRMPKAEPNILKAPKIHAERMPVPHASHEPAPRAVEPKHARMKIPSSASKLEGFSGGGKMGKAY